MGEIFPVKEVVVPGYFKLHALPFVTEALSCVR